eukprot:TRINITY_DN35241_c0_g1_i1.p1 TRINITY_DN35241_c0_g1~~TRINITY_DN35241_c0_g1_i1.p1  ORF type:complete len:562 (-),score=75.96 TRINITY_DN35241_c0_g1_i1:77-1762(-)
MSAGGATRLHRFHVQIGEFAVESLVLAPPLETSAFVGFGICGRPVCAQDCELYLAIDFGGQRFFKTEHARNVDGRPAWSFAAGFDVVISELSRLHDSALRIQCLDKTTSCLIGEASVELYTIACGSPNFKLSLRNCFGPHESSGYLRFVCVMKLFSDISVVAKRLQLMTVAGRHVPPAMRVSSSLVVGDNCREPVTVVSHGPEGQWSESYELTFVSTLADLLKAPAIEKMRFVVTDGRDVPIAEASLPFRDAFSVEQGAEVPFKIDVTSQSRLADYRESHVADDGRRDVLWSLEGCLVYRGLPPFAQMVSGCCVDGEVVDGFSLANGLPYPKCLAKPPLLWRDPKRVVESESRHVEWSGQLRGALEDIPLPSPWEQCLERSALGMQGCEQHVYFADPRSRRTTRKDPRFLPAHWEQRIDSKSGRIYYQYHPTQQTTYVDPRCCPPGWDMRLSKRGDVYFFYVPAMRSTDDDPRGLPDGIDMALDKHGRVYFRRHREQTTQWEDPRRGQCEAILMDWRQAESVRWWEEQVLRYRREFTGSDDLCWLQPGTTAESQKKKRGPI